VLTLLVTFQQSDKRFNDQKGENFSDVCHVWQIMLCMSVALEEENRVSAVMRGSFERVKVAWMVWGGTAGVIDW
jgi:hypothetical protein